MNEEWDTVTTSPPTRPDPAIVMIAMIEIVRELMIDVARLKTDPENYLVALYERVVSRLENGGESSYGFFSRDAANYVEVIFQDALKTLRDT